MQKDSVVRFVELEYSQECGWVGSQFVDMVHSAVEGLHALAVI